MTTKKISVLCQATDVLDCFTAENDRLSLAYLNAKLKIPKITLQRILNSLEDEEVLVYDQNSGQYSLGARVLKWGGNLLNRLKIQELVRSYLESLRDLTMETAFLSVRVGTNRMHITQVESIYEMRGSLELGKQFPLYAGACGKSILAFAGRELFEQVISEHSLKKLTATTITNKNELESELSRIREEGFAVSLGEQAEGMVSVAAPLFSISGELIGSIGLSGPNNRFTLEKAHEYGPLVTKVAKEMSRTILWINGNEYFMTHNQENRNFQLRFFC